MQAGFALLETGMVRAKNVTHTMAMNVVVFCGGALGFWLCGFAVQNGFKADLFFLGGRGLPPARLRPVLLLPHVHGHGRHHPDRGDGQGAGASCRSSSSACS